MAQNEIAKATVDVDGAQAGAELKKLEERAKELRTALVNLGRENDLAGFRKTEKELRLVNSSMKNLQKETFDVEKVLKRLNGANFNELTRAQRVLRSEIKGMNRETQEEIRLYNEKIGKLKLVDQELGKVKNEMYAVDRAQKGWMGNAAGSFNKMAGWITGITATITGIAYSFNRSVVAANEFEESLNNLSALTGLQGNDLQWLSERAKQFSVETTKSGIRIRQSAKEILDAYTIMGSQRPELLKDKEALSAVTEQAIILSEAGKIKLEPAVAALANTMNQFNLSGDEAARVVNVIAAGSKVGAADIDYVSTAIEKAGTTASLMGISVEQAVGAIETVGPKFSEASVAGNSLDKVLLKMAEKQIGYKDGVFDLSLALDQLAGMFNNGVSASSIFGVEHAKMAEVLVQGRADFAKYTQEVTGTNVAVEQAAINTDTNAAKLAQAKNKLSLVAIEIGSRVAPAFTFATNVMAGLGNALVGLIKIFSEYKGVLITGTASILAYALTVNAVTIAKKLYSTATTIATAATRVFNTVMKSNPWGLVASAIAGAVTALIVFSRNMNTVSAETKVQTKLNEALADSLSKELGPMTQAFDRLKNLNISADERKELIKSINEQYGQYLPNLLTEKSTIQEIEAAQNAANISLEASLTKKVRAQVLTDLITEKIKKQLELEGMLREQVGDVGIESLEQDAKYARDIIDRNYENELIKAGLQGKKKEELRGKELETFLNLEATYNSNIENLRKEALNQSTYDTKEMAKTRQDLNDLTEQIYYTEELINSTKETPVAGKGKVKVAPVNPVAPTGEDKSDELKRQEEYRKSILNSTRSLIEQENIAYQQRLDDAGIFMKKKEDMTQEDIRISEILEKDHINNLKKINSDQADFDLKKEQEDFDKITLLKQIAHNNELAAVANNEDEKAEVQRRFEEEELERKRLYLEKLVSQLQGALAGEDTFQGIDETLLSDEEVAAFQAKIEQLKLLLSELGLKKAELASGGSTGGETPAFGEQADFAKGLKTDIFGMSQEDWINTIDNIRSGNFSLEDTVKIVGAISEAWEMVNQIRKNQEDKALMEYESNINSKKEILQKQLDQGLISQDTYNQQVASMDEDLDKRKKAIALKQAKREKALALMGAIVNVALGITKALTTFPTWLGIALAALVGVMGGLQIATIATQPLPQYSSGYYEVTGQKDGKKYRGPILDSAKTGIINQPSILVGEKPEIIIDPHTTRNLQMNYPEVIDAINYARAPQYGSGKYPSTWITTDTSQSPAGAKQLPPEFYETITGLRNVLQELSRNGIEAKLLANGEYIKKHNDVASEYEELKRQTSMKG